MELDFSGFVYAVPTANAVVAAREKDADTTRTELCKQVAQGRRIFQREIQLFITVRDANCLRDFLLVENVVEPLEESVARSWLVFPYRQMAAGAVEG